MNFSNSGKMIKEAQKPCYDSSGVEAGFEDLKYTVEFGDNNSTENTIALTAGAHYTQSRQCSMQEESGDSAFPRNFNAPLQMTAKSCPKEADTQSSLSTQACILEIGVAVEDFQARKRQDLSFKRGDKILIE